MAALSSRPAQSPGGLLANLHTLPYCNVVRTNLGKTTMAWTTPTLVEICLGLEINGYLPAEF
jgi:coenzyme PQQ precursor peptide PqqA